MLRHEPKEMFDTGEVALPRTRAERIGPYVVVREVARAPGARFVEAEGPGDTRVLLQVVRLRAPADEADRLARQRYERSLGARTAALFDEPELEIRAQGGADLADGTRWIYWARAWSGAPVDPASLSPIELERVARDLLDRLVRRHAQGRTEPLLHARTLWRSADDRFGVAGVPIGVESGWMAPSEPTPSRAPGEGAEADVGGDLWRLGQALGAITEGRGDVSPALSALLETLQVGDDVTMTEADPAITRRVTVEVALRVLDGANPPPAAASWADEVSGASDVQAAEGHSLGDLPAAPREIEESAEVAASPAQAAGPDEAAAAPGDADAVAEVQDHRTDPGSPVAVALAAVPVVTAAPDAASSPSDAIDAATTRIELVPPVAPPAALVQSPMDSAELETIEAPAPTEQNTDPALGASDAVTHQTRPAEPAGPSQPAIIPVDPSELSTSMQRIFSVDTVTDGRPLPRSLRVEDGPVDPAAVAWAPALLPEGASPWSEVIRPRPARPTFTGFPGELPAVGPGDVAETTAPHGMVRASEPPGPLAATTPVVIPPEIRRPPAALTPARRMAIAAGATLLVLGLVAQWSRGRDAPIEAMDGLVVTAVNDVTVDTQPAGATVVAEADGRVLGTTPMRFVVPGGADAAVILLRSGYDPQRLVLPDRGGIVAMLTPVATTPCEIAIEAVPSSAIEGVGVDVGRGPRFAIPGAAVVRTRGDAAAGARIVRCPEAPRDAPLVLRFGAPNVPSTVRITHPAGATASIEGTEVGVVPAARAVVSAFARVRVADPAGAVVERWIPSRSDVEVQMPGAEAARVDPPPPAIVDPTPITVPAFERTEPRREPARNKADALGLLREATELLQAGHAEQARARLEACLRADPGIAACHRGLAEVFRRGEQRSEARSHYARYLELAPDAPDVALVRSLMREIE